MIHHVVFLTFERRCVTFFSRFQFIQTKKTRLNLKRVLNKLCHIQLNSSETRQISGGYVCFFSFRLQISNKILKKTY